jgi:hypothetical protein
MQLISKDEELIYKLQHNLSLTSSQILKICIFNSNDKLCIDVELELLYVKDKKRIVLNFIDVQEYSFYHSFDQFFYNVEIFRFVKANSFFYISFDPIDEGETISDEDQDFIKAKSVIGYFV